MWSALVPIPLVLALVGSPLAQAPSPDVKLEAGIRQVQEGDLARAVETLGEVVRELSDQPGRTKELAQAHLYLGMAYVLLDYEKAGRASFREALGLDPGLRLQPGQAPVKVQRVFDAVREATAARVAPPAAAAPAPRAEPAYPIVAHAWDYQQDDASWDVRAISLAGESRVLAGGPGNQIYPFTFPGGRSVGYMVEGSGSENRDFLKVDVSSGVVEGLGVHNSSGSACQVAPDGKRLACADDIGQGKQVVIYDLASRERRPVERGRNDCYDPTWSPDGKSLAYWTGKNEEEIGAATKPKGYHLAIYDLKTDKHRLLTRAPKAYDAYPRWAPNGEWIAFHRKGKSRGQWNIWIVHPDGTGETQLTDGRRESSHPSWSPDSRRIVFQVYRPDPDTYDVAVVDVASRQVTPVTQTDQVTEEYPVWIK